MNQRAKGLHALLSKPTVYDFVQRVFGSTKSRQRFANEVLCPGKGDRVLDIGCGTADILRYLTDVEYVGFEPEPAYVERARAVFGTRATFHLGLFDADAAAAMQPMDLAFATGVLHHMSDDEVRELFRLLRIVVKPGHRVVTIDPVYVAGQNPIARLFISLDRGRHVRTPEHYARLARESFSDVSGRVNHMRFPPYSHWLMTLT